MRVFCSLFAVMGVLGATEASAANWNEGTIYAPNGIIAQLERGTVVREDIGEPEPAPIVLAEARKAAKRAPQALRSMADGASLLALGAVPAIRNIVSVCGSSTATSPMRGAARPTLRDGSHPAVPSR